MSDSVRMIAERIAESRIAPVRAHIRDLRNKIDWLESRKAEFEHEALLNYFAGVAMASIIGGMAASKAELTTDEIAQWAWEQAYSMVDSVHRKKKDEEVPEET